MCELKYLIVYKPPCFTQDTHVFLYIHVVLSFLRVGVNKYENRSKSMQI